MRFVGLNHCKPALADLLWDATQAYGDLFRLWGVDFLHHVQLGVFRRLGVDLLQVRCRTMCHAGEKAGLP